MADNMGLQVALHLMGLLLVIIDFLLWVITLGPIWMIQGYLSVPNRWSQPFESARINEKLPASAVWRAPKSIEDGGLLTSPFPTEKLETLYDLMARAYKLYADREAQGVRPLLSWRKDDGFRFPAKVFGPTQWRTYKELGDLAKAFGSGLRALGVDPQGQGDFNDLTGKFKILMYEDTCAEWMVCAQGAFTQDVVVATAYATLGTEAVVHAVNEGAVSVIVCNRKNAETMANASKSMPSLEAVIYTDYGCTPEEITAKVVVAGASVKILSLDEVLEMGKAKPMEPTPPKGDSVAVLMYTSGSTGNPKGVIVRHRQMLAVVGACKAQFGCLLNDSGETFIGYLPLAHILELTAEMYFYGTGNRIGYADPKTLLAGPERAYPTGALEDFRPSLMAGVPKVWETIKKGAEVKVAKSGAVKSFLFKLALKVKKAAILQHRYTPLFDLLVFKKLKQTLGGNMKFCLSGGGSISGEVQEWVRAAFSCPCIQGYGLTESCGATTIQHPHDVSIGIAGSVLPCVEIALHSEPDITDSNGKPYLCTDAMHADGTDCEGRGEVWIRGNNITSGYYKMPKVTAEEFDKDGWFHTGDIGMMSLAGQLKIVDRKKNLVKLKGGEYVALEMMNIAYNNADIINVDAGGVCAFADHDIDRPVVFAQCKAKELTELAAEAGVTGKEGTELCRDPKVMAAVKAKLDPAAKAAKLPALMHAIAVMPVLEPWTAQNGCLTATSKLVPKAVFKLHAEDLKVLKSLATKG
mmetsp:Transcript_8270/g.17982  ORF Transcript_8270/g.17982 Transcript_8270/m.17982 type:complete len:749 (-) Transcript_8270:100-2346(-)